MDGRLDQFDLAVSTAVEFIRGSWPEVRDVRFDVAAMPATDHPDGMPRWHVDERGKRITLYRIPIERLLLPGHDDALHRRVAIESAVFRAAAEFAGRDPWELDPPYDP